LGKERETQVSKAMSFTKKAGMDRLSDRDRETIRLRDFDGLSLMEMAEALELSESATKSSHFRARRRRARVSAVRVLYGVHREGADGAAAQAIPVAARRR
jgi:DNA-directed RNA polymerase specialized sigma24 family protein